MTVDNHSEPMEEQELNTGAPEQEKEKSSRQTVIVDMTTEQESRRNYKKALLKDSNPDRVSIQPSLTRNVTAEDLMEEMATTIGFRGITAEMIKHWEWKIEENLLQEVDDDKIFKHSDHDEARTDTIKDICYNKLGFEECNIKIRSVRSATNPKSQILWVKGDKNFIKQIYQNASKIRDNSVRLLQYYPAATMARRDALERILKVIREKAPKNMINTQVRPGTKDIEAWIKINHPGQRNFYKKKSLNQLDPNLRLT